MTAFDRAFQVVIGEEGGYVNNPADPGGETKFGISARSYPALDIAALTLDTAKQIYQRDFWAKAGCAALSPPLALVVFDCAVNCGPGRAVRWLQQAAGLSGRDIDGVCGHETLNAVNIAIELHGGAALCAGVLAASILFHADLPTWRKFGGGWSKRMAWLPYYSVQMGTTA